MRRLRLFGLRRDDLGDVERGRRVGLVAGEGPSADLEGFALVLIPVLSDRFCELARGLVILGGERNHGLDECPVMPSAASGVAARIRPSWLRSAAWSPSAS